MRGGRPGSSGQTDEEKNLERWPEHAGPRCGLVQLGASTFPKAATRRDLRGHPSRTRDRAQNVHASAGGPILITSQILSFAFSVHPNALTQSRRESFLYLVLTPLTQKARVPTVGTVSGQLAGHTISPSCVWPASSSDRWSCERQRPGPQPAISTPSVEMAELPKQRHFQPLSSNRYFTNSSFKEPRFM